MAKFCSHYTCSPKCFELHSSGKMWKKFFFYASIISLLFLKKCNIYIDSVSFIQMLWPETLLVSCNILGNELTLNRNPNLNYQPKPVLGHNTGFNFLMSACRIKGQARKICTTLTNMVGGWKYFWKKKWWSQPILMATKYFFNNTIIQ